MTTLVEVLCAAGLIAFCAGFPIAIAVMGMSR